MVRVGVLCGLKREADIVQRLADQAGLPVDVRITAADQERTIREADDLAFSDATHLLSFGLAGALDPALRPGTLLFPESVVILCRRTGNPSLSGGTDTDWLNSLKKANPHARTAQVLGVENIVDSAESKADLLRRSGADIIDMESHHLAAAARAAAKPFAVIRAIADTANMDLPAPALAGVDGDGRARVWPVLRELVGQPSAISGLIKLGSASESAFRSLARVTLQAPENVAVTA